MDAARALSQLKEDLASCVVTDSETLSRFRRDFAGRASRSPIAVAMPSGVPQLGQLIAWAAGQKMPLTLRGSGHSQAGQTLLDGGIVVDMRGMSGVGTIDQKNQLVEVEGGASWASVVQKTLPNRLAPRVLTSEHGTTVGGTLSVGGLGSTSFRYGAQVDNVAFLDVVTGTGELVRCSPFENSDLFNVVRGGLGQFGAIARAGLLLRAVSPRLRTFTFVYDSATAFLDDLERLMSADDGTHLLAHLTPVAGSERKRVHLTVGFEFHPGLEPDPTRFRDLSCDETLPYADTDLFGENHIFYFRYADWFGISPDFVYPWVDHYFRWERAREYLAAVLQGRFSPLLKMGVNTIIPVAVGKHTAPLLTRQASENPLLLVGLFPKLPVALADLSDLLLTYADQVETEFAATRYLYGYADPARANWARHFGAHWPTVQHMKRRFDPMGVFNPDFLATTSLPNPD